MSEQEAQRDDAPPADPEDARLEMNDTDRSDVDWDETESSPHAGEEGQEPV
jgi:hypothetical protein